MICVALTVWAAIGFVGSGEPREVLRAGLSLGLAAAMAVSIYRLRPRDEWGVKVTPLSVLISKPRGGLIELPWSAIKTVRRFGEKRETLALFTGEQDRVLVPRHLFASTRDFELLAHAIDERMPEQKIRAN